MTEKQTEVKQEIHAYFNKYREKMPGMSQAYDIMTSEAYAGGALDGKTKRLMALAIALVGHCRGCVLTQCGRALEQGASVDEILEACAVAMSMGGTMAAAETTRVMQYLEEVGKI